MISVNPKLAWVRSSCRKVSVSILDLFPQSPKSTNRNTGPDATGIGVGVGDASTTGVGDETGVGDGINVSRLYRSRTIRATTTPATITRVTVSAMLIIFRITG